MKGYYKLNRTLRTVLIPSVTLLTNTRSLTQLAPIKSASCFVANNSNFGISALNHRSGFKWSDLISSNLFWMTCIGVAPFAPWLQNATFSLYLSFPSKKYFLISWPNLGISEFLRLKVSDIFFADVVIDDGNVMS